MKTRIIRTLQLAVAALPLLAPAAALAWQPIVQYSPSEVWFGYAMAAQNKLNEGWHPTAVDVHYSSYNSSYTKMTLCLVKKEGAFNIPAKVLYDKTWDEIADWAVDNGYTVIDQEEYLKSGQKRYAAVLHKLNPLVDWFAYTDQKTPWLEGFVLGNGGKIIDMDLEEYGGTSSLFGTILFSDAYSGVVWDSSMDFNDIAPYYLNHNKRILDISRRLDGTYCVLFCDEKPSDVGKWGWFGGADAAWLNNAQAAGWRVQKRNSLTANGVTTYSGVLVRKF